MIMWILLGIGLTIILVLSSVAGYYLYLVKRQKEAQKKQKQELKLVAEKKRKEHVRSIVLLSRALIQDEVSLTEASIRINAIASAIDLTEESRETLSVFKQLSEATSHIPILDAWKKLSRSEKNRLEKERLSIEKKYADFVKAAAQKILDGPESLNATF